MMFSQQNQKFTLNEYKYEIMLGNESSTSNRAELGSTN